MWVREREWKREREQKEEWEVWDWSPSNFQRVNLISELSSAIKCQQEKKKEIEKENDLIFNIK